LHRKILRRDPGKLFAHRVEASLSKRLVAASPLDAIGFKEAQDHFLPVRIQNRTDVLGAWHHP